MSQCLFHFPMEGSSPSSSEYPQSAHLISWVAAPTCLEEELGKLSSFLNHSRNAWMTFSSCFREQTPTWRSSWSGEDPEGEAPCGAFILSVSSKCEAKKASAQRTATLARLAGAESNMALAESLASPPISSPFPPRRAKASSGRSGRAFLWD